MARRGLAISPNAAFWTVMLELSACSAYFVFYVQSRRAVWAAKRAADVKSGDAVQLLKVIDGDELSVRGKSGPFVVRMLGIKSFKPSTNDPGLSQVGMACVAAIKRILQDKKITVEFTTHRRDKAGRLLAYLHAGGRDVGQLLLQQGHTIVFTRYPFGREKTYLGIEQEARTRKLGLWANARADMRATALKATWETQRGDD